MGCAVECYYKISFLAALVGMKDSHRMTPEQEVKLLNNLPRRSVYWLAWRGYIFCAFVAQLVEHRPEEAGVIRSSRIGSTNAQSWPIGEALDCQSSLRGVRFSSVAPIISLHTLPEVPESRRDGDGSSNGSKGLRAEGACSKGRRRRKFPTRHYRGVASQSGRGTRL